MSGTSFAAPFLTGAIALLWSIFPKATAGQIINSIRGRKISKNNNRSIVPQLLNVEASYRELQKTTRK